MEIKEIMDIQRKCRKQAKEMTKQAYSKYDAIWTAGIKITPVLEEMGVVGEINAKMPNMLSRNQERLEIGEIAAKYGFASPDELVNYLLAYEPRSNHEENVFACQIREKMTGCMEEEIELAISKKPGEIMRVLKGCRETAKLIIEQTYEKYDEIWAGKIRITPALQRHGSDTVCEINRKMPNMLTHNVCCSAIDQVAMEYKFESDQDLVDFLLDYKPRVSYMENICESLARQAFGLPDCDASQKEPIEFDEAPF